MSVQLIFGNLLVRQKELTGMIQTILGELLIVKLTIALRQVVLEAVDLP